MGTGQKSIKATSLFSTSKASRGWPLRAQELGYQCTQRFFDIVVSVGLLATAFPVLLLIGVLIKRDSHGAVLFKHVRVGRGGKPFTLYKFRTMYADAQKRFPELYTYDYSEEELSSLPIKILVGKKFGAERFKGKVENSNHVIDDPRITPLGCWLRKTSLDELPNFINVLKGDMHLVGPRPDIAENVKYYTPFHLRKLEVKPGITGLAQVKGRGELSFHQINDYDVEYVENKSCLLDIKILLKTVVTSIKKEGAY